MPSRRLLAPLLLAALITASAVGCAPEPAPTPTPTGWASEDEAFAAAEATYRAYVDALNQVNLADPATFEPVYEWLTGDALNSSKKSLTQMHADGWTVGGPSVPRIVQPVTFDKDAQQVTLAICVDVSAVTLVDAEGASQVGERPTEQSLFATVELGTPSRIDSFAGREGDPECAP